MGVGKAKTGNSSRAVPKGLTPWTKGKSGNPSGRPKIREDLKARCIRLVDDLVIDSWVKEVQALGPEWVRCSELLAAYGYGKPAQMVEHSGNVNIRVIDPYAEPANG